MVIGNKNHSMDQVTTLQQENHLPQVEVTYLEAMRDIDNQIDDLYQRSFEIAHSIRQQEYYEALKAGCVLQRLERDELIIWAKKANSTKFIDLDNEFDKLKNTIKSSNVYYIFSPIGSINDRKTIEMIRFAMGKICIAFKYFPKETRRIAEYASFLHSQIVGQYSVKAFQQGIDHFINCYTDIPDNWLKTIKDLISMYDRIFKDKMLAISKPQIKKCAISNVVKS